MYHSCGAKEKHPSMWGRETRERKEMIKSWTRRIIYFCLRVDSCNWHLSGLPGIAYDVYIAPPWGGFPSSIARQLCKRVPIQNDTSSESSWRDVSNADRCCTRHYSNCCGDTKRGKSKIGQGGVWYTVVYRTCMLPVGIAFFRMKNIYWYMIYAYDHTCMSTRIYCCIYTYVFVVCTPY